MIVTSQSYYTDNLVARKLRELWIRLPDWSKQDQKPQYTAEEVGAMPVDAIISYNSLDSAVQASLDKANTALQEEVDPVFTASPSHGITSTDITNWDNKQVKLRASTVIGSIYRTNVSGGGNISINGTSGQFPVVTNAGTYLVITEMESTTQSYGLNVTFGSNQYTLETTNGSFYDSRQLTLSANSRWSGSVVGNVAPSSKISVKVLKEIDEITTVGVVAVTNDYADLINKPTIPNVSGYFDGVVYDSNTKRINFKHGNSVLTYIDATAFIKDGMVNSVVIENGKLVITFNTDSGKEPIEIDITDIFDPANYYDKTTMDSLLGDKADTSSLATIATSGDYGDLLNLPDLTIYAESSNLSTVATSGSYNDLLDLPTIPTITFKQW